MENQIVLYGLAGADKQYIAVRYKVLSGDKITIGNIKHCAAMMMIEYPTIESVYAVDNRYGLRRDYMDSILKHSIESCAVFKGILEDEGWKVV